jgi:integrase
MATISRHGKGWRVQIRRKGHPPLSETFPLRKQAEAWAAQRESEIVQGKLGLLPKHTLAEALAKFREEKARNRWEVNRIKVLERDTIAKVPLAALDSSHLSDLRDRELRRGVQGTTARRLFSLLASVFKAARADWRWMNHDPFRDFERPPPKKGRARGLRQPEIDAMVKALGWVAGTPQTASQQVAVAFLLAIETGMRAGELLTLTWPNVHEKRVHLPKTKNGDARDVPLSLRARELIDAMRGIDPELVFTVAEGSRDALFRDARKTAQVAGFTFHDTRSEAISRLSKKLDIRELARMVGHRDLASLMHYYTDQADEVADKLD